MSNDPLFTESAVEEALLHVNITSELRVRVHGTEFPTTRP